jgi:hypothetical protein
VIVRVLVGIAQVSVIVRAVWVAAIAAVWVKVVAGTALAAETFREAAVNETWAPLEVAGALAAVLPVPVAREVLPVWEAEDSVVVVAAECEAVAAGEAVVGDSESGKVNESKP